MVQKSLSCLKASLTVNRTATLGNTYTTALMAYVFTLAGDTGHRTILLEHLDQVAVTEGKPGLQVTSAWILSSACANPTSCFFFRFLQEVSFTGIRSQLRRLPLCRWRSVPTSYWPSSAARLPLGTWATPPASSDGSPRSRTTTEVSHLLR